MKKRLLNMSNRLLNSLAITVLVLGCALQGFAQTPTPVPAGTGIKNVASASYSDASSGGTTYNSVSNEVTVTVAKVAGLTITPDNDASTNSAGNKVAGATGVEYNFTITNTGNFANDISVSKDAMQISSGGVVTRVQYSTDGTTWVDWGTSSGSGSTATWSPASSNLTFNDLVASGTILFKVTARIETTATAGSQVTVTFGDAGGSSPFDSVVTSGTASTNEVRTTDTTATNGLLEAKGVVSALVINDAIPNVTLSAPTGPVSAGSTITYTAQNCNTGAQDLTNAYLLITVPAGTVFDPTTLGASSAISSVLYSTTDTASGSFSSTVPSPTSSIKYVKVFLNPTTLASGGIPSSGVGCVNITWNVTVNTNFDADNPVSATVTLAGNNTLGVEVTDISGAGVSGTPTNTSVSKTGAVLVGPNGSASAVGTVDRDGDSDTDNNDDFQEKIFVPSTPVAPGTDIGGSGGSVTFVNTLSNGGNASDTFTVTAPVAPAGSTIEVCFNYNTTTLACNVAWTTITSSTSATSPSVDNGSTLNFLTRVTLPSTTDSGTIASTTITATSVTDTTKSNNTINDVVVGGAMKIEKSFSCAATINGTPYSSASGDAEPSKYCVPGAVVTYTIKYTNISRTLTAYNFVIVEDGDAGSNNWLATTNRVVGSEFDYAGATGINVGTGVINAYAADTSQVTDTVATVNPGYVGRLVFQRTIK